MFSYPLWVACSSIEGGDCREGRVKVGDWAWEAILEKTVWIYWRDDVFETGRIRWNRCTGR